ncbi:uncharacterized protein LOC131255446 [Magnolia sinica]|uniref:uncharacterized protein LOC131255446 n=1 Tax=Magnolia sinica TaxID=86752 RepID=UPI00265886A2|nr:uncharacterized protein LOC131255446 [Magnolia sinica]XP_058112147.1 uncharacterized protein LOC131255446 [Magnolia sinica]
MLHGREGEEWKPRRHMWPVPATTVTAAPPPPHGPSPAPDPAANSFVKDGRKVSVGDCALFQSGNSLPHIGIIRWLTSGKEDCFTLGVNWLYRPADVKLAKGALLEAAPNEVFYSFHKDETSAASLLHPCKVAFLRKGVELPSGISAFVCRRVYDIANKCLWWLTDQDYIDERQEEVDQLLDKTRLEMHAAVQSGGRSPKPLNGPASTQPLKPASDSTQNSTTSFASQGKGKKREQCDRGLEPIKRERSSKAGDAESGHLRKESMIKAEVAKILDKGGIINLEAVEKLVHLMQIDRAEKKIDLAGRVMLADVIAATERPDCLGRFVNLRGVPILDDWLQEAHKGKFGDGSSPRESDKSVEEFLLAVLRALDKLPVNLHALQTSNVGKSVNHLRSHKNLEIQKKARSLVDTWKKRVEAEMKINDAKSGSNQAVSWPGKPGFSEVSHGGNRRSGSSEVAAKSSISQPASSKMGPVKLGHGDSVAKSTSASPGSVKVIPLLPASAGISSKDLNCKMAGSSGASDIPLTTIKEEKSSNSSQSQNNSQSYSSDQAKSAASASKEDAKNSAAGSTSAKTTGVSRTRKSSNGFLGSGVQKETTASGKSVSLGRTTIADKVSQTRLMSEGAPDMRPADLGNSHRLIVRLPNPGRSPARSASGGSFEDPLGSRAASPGASEKLDHIDRKAKGKSDISWANTSTDVNTESWQSNDVKDGLSGLVEGDRSPKAAIDEEHRITGDIAKSMDASRGTYSPSGNEKGAFFAETNTGRQYEGSFSSINALIESCVKCSEVSTSLSADDDIGMNLLASVAAGEIPKSDPVSPSSSPGRSSPTPEDPFTGNNSTLRSSHDDDVAQGHSQHEDGADADPGRQVNMVGPKQIMDESRQISTPPIDSISGDSKSSLPLPEQKSSGEQSEQIPPSCMDSCQTVDLGIKSDPRPDVTATDGSVAGTTGLISIETCLPESREECSEGGGATQLPEKRISGENTDGADIKPNVRTPPDEDKTTNYAGEKSADSSMSPDSVRGSMEGGCEIEQAASIKKIEEAAEESPSCPPLENDRGRDTNNVPEADATTTEQRPPPVAANHVEALERGSVEAAAPSGSGSVLHSDDVGEPKPEQAEGMETSSHLEGTGDNERVEHTSPAPLTLDDRAGSGVGTVVVNQNNVDRLEEKSNRKDLSLSSPSEVLPTITSQENGRLMKFTLSKLSSVEDEMEECASPAEGSSVANVVGSDITTKLDFDLNEGFAVDEGNQGELVTSTTSGCMSAVHLPSPLPFSVSPVSSGLPTSITVAAAAKGAFVHPEHLLRSKGDRAWKGSASNTSAFKPPDRRKGLEMPLSTTDITSSDTTGGKQGRSPLNIDLNVPDERLLEDMASRSSVQEAGSGSVGTSNCALGCIEMSGSSPAPIRSAGLDLDLNRADEGPENGQFSASTSRRFEVPLLPGRSSSSGGFPNGEMNVLRDFDLNNGPGFDEMGAEAAAHNQHAKANVQYLPPVSSVRMNNTELPSISSWFPGNSYRASFLHDREQSYPTVATASSQRMLGSAAGGATFAGDIYRPPLLSSSPAMAFSPAASFPYAGFPFGNNFSLASTSFSGGSTAYMDSSSGGACFPTVPSQLVGAGGAVSSQYMRPYPISLPESTTSSSGAENNRKLSRHGLDLNAGPGSGDIEGRDERLPSASRQLPVANSQALLEEQARMYQVAAGALKRKEPEGGWDADRFSYRQTSWQ